MHQLLIMGPHGRKQTVLLKGERLCLGRSQSNELAYPEDGGLSRQHLAIERDGEGWVLRDMGSKNGTFLNGAPVPGAAPLRQGDRITASRMVLVFDPAPAKLDDRTVVFETRPGPEGSLSAVSTTLDRLLAREPPPQDIGETSSPSWLKPVQAVVRATREMAARRPLAEIFQTILDLAIEAVQAERGVLMTLEEDGTLEVQASRGEGFRISTAIRDRVIEERASILVGDTQLDRALRERNSIVFQNVRALMAVPLETNERVIGLIYVDSHQLLRRFSADDLSLLTLMASVAAVRIERERLAAMEESRRLLASELEQAAEIQRQHLPASAPSIPGLDICGHNAPCRTVGGDYYDFIPYPDSSLGVVVADVAGKGMPASLLMMSLQARIQVLGDKREPPGELLTTLNRSLARGCPKNRFISLFFCVVDAPADTLSYCNAGHNPPLLVTPDGSVKEMEGHGAVMGVFPEFQYGTHAIPFSPGHMLVMYSDGVTEACSPAGEEFGVERLARIVSSAPGLPAAGVVRLILEGVQEWTHRAAPADDVTLVVARRT